MYELIVDDKEYHFRNGQNVLGKDLKNRPGYELINITTCVLDIVGNVIISLDSLDKLCTQYNVENNNDETTVEKINIAKNLDNQRRLDMAKMDSASIRAAKIFALSFTDAQALEVRELYPEFELNHEYKKDERFTYNGRLFKVNQAHTSQEQWVPGEQGTESLYTNLEMGENGQLNWQQPTGAHDAYNTGDIVNYNGQLYQSKIDGNVWSPDAYPQGWEIYNEA